MEASLCFRVIRFREDQQLYLGWFLFFAARLHL
jgi:hypothetical protein